MFPLEFEELPAPEALVASAREHGLVVVHGARVDLQRHLELMAAFGPIQADPVASPARPLVRTIDDRRATAAARRRIVFDEQYHADLSWYPDAVAVTSLWADDIGAGAPPTSFIDGRAAARRLPAELAASVRGRRALHHTQRSRQLRHPQVVAAQGLDTETGVLERAHDRIGRLRHRIQRGRPWAMAVAVQRAHVLPPPGTAVPVIDHDPRSGDEIVRLGDHAWTIEGMSDDEGRALVDRCNEAIAAGGPDHVHRWEPGDLLVFDNRLVLHRREPTATPGRRRLRRVVALAGD